MNRLQIFKVAVHIALVDALLCPSVAKEMFGRRDHASRSEPVIIGIGSLQPLDQSGTEFSNQRRVFGIAFIGSTPAIILGNGNGRREVPVNAGHFDLDGRNVSNPAHEVCVASRAESDIVREDRGAHNIGMPVHSIRAPNGRDHRFITRKWRGRCVPHFLGKREPFPSGCEFVTARASIAAIEVAAEPISLHVIGSE